METFNPFGGFNATNVVAAAGGTPPNATIPTLLSATKVPATRATWDLVYNTNVEANAIDAVPGDAAGGGENCVAFLEDGSFVRQTPASGASRSEHAAGHVRHRERDRRGNDTDNSLGTERKSEDKIVLIADDPQVDPVTGVRGNSCVRESAAAAQQSAKASVPAQGNQPVAPGFTDGPDLTSCFYTQGQEGVVFVFDRRQNICPGLRSRTSAW